MIPNLIVPFQRKFHLKDGPTRRCLAQSDKTPSGNCRLQSLAMALWVREIDIDPDCVKFVSEPGYILFGEKRKYFPDFVLWRRDRSVSVVEVKSSAKRFNPILLERFRKIRTRCNEAGCGFELIFSDRLYREPKRSNVALIHYYKDEAVSELDLDTVRSFFASHAEASISEALVHCNGLTRPKLYALVAKGHLWVNLFRPINDDAVIRLRRARPDHLGRASVLPRVNNLLRDKSGDPLTI